MKRIFLTVATVAIFFLTNYFTVAQFGFGGGTGSPTNPYQIRTKAHLEELADSANTSALVWSLHRYFVLMNDITDTVRTIIAYSSSDTFRGFYRHFDGQGFKIVLGINNQSNNYLGIGLFGAIGNGSISNLTVEGYVISNAVNTGAIAGRTAWISYGGGAIIKNCINNCTVVGENAVGGIIGNVGNINTNAQIENCINNGNIKGLGRIGGIVGNYAVSSERIIDPQHYIRNCINYGFVQGETNVGGIVGRVEHISTDADVTVSNCINIGVITGKSETGCIIGYKSGSVTVENCHFDKQMCSGNGIGGE